MSRIEASEVPDDKAPPLPPEEWYARQRSRVDDRVATLQAGKARIDSATPAERDELLHDLFDIVIALAKETVDNP